MLNAKSPTTRLSDAQIEALELFMDGMTQPEIASLLRVHPNTVKYRLGTAKRVLGLEATASRYELTLAGRAYLDPR